MKRTLIVLASSMILVGAGLVVLGSCSSAKERTGAGSEDVMAELRKMFLSLTPEKAGIKVPAAGQGIWGGAMDLSVENGTATVISVIDGTASLYFSTGGGILGGEAHEPVRKAVQAFVKSLESCSPELKPGPAQHLPEAGKVRIYGLSRSGLLHSEEISETDVQDESHPLHPCYSAAQEVITQLRLITEDIES